MKALASIFLLLSLNTSVPVDVTDSVPIRVSPTVEDHEAICDSVIAGTITDRRCFFISNTGDDLLDGRTKNNAWETISKINGSSFLPGDIILFEKGGEWRLSSEYDSLLVTSSGESEKWITYGAYGSGDKPKILGSINASSWVNVTGNIWSSAAPVPTNPNNIYYGSQIFFEKDGQETTWGQFRSYSAGFGNLTKEYDWTWNANTVYIYSPDNPNVRYNAVEAPQALRLILLGDHSYIAFDSLVLKYMVSAGIYDVYNTTVPVKGLRLTNSEIAYIGIKNSSSAYGLALRRSDIYVGNNSIHDCGRRSISLNLYNDTPPGVIEGVLVENNHFYNGFHTTGIDAAAGTTASGSHIIKDVTIRNNFFEGNPDYDIGEEDGHTSNQMWVFQSDTGDVGDFYIYNNLFTHSHGSSLKLSGGDNYLIFNNTFYNFNLTIPSYQAHVYTGNNITSVAIKNNIFQNDVPHTRQACIKIDDGDQNQYTIDNNLYFSNSDARLLWVNGTTSHYAISDWEAYRTNNPGFDTNSPDPSNPYFINPPSDLGLQVSSPAIGAGTRIGGITTDFLGGVVGNPPDIGAIQY